MDIRISTKNIKNSLRSKLILTSATQFDNVKRTEWYDRGVEQLRTLWMMDAITDAIYFSTKQKFRDALEISTKEAEYAFDSSI